ncbi:uncharacterized protein LOC120343998 [Styela clava]
MQLVIAESNVVLCLIVFSYHVLRAAGQFDTSTDLDRCCSREPNTTHSDSTCRPTRLSATQFQQSIVTPNYPKAFPADLFCSWEIRTMPGRRILLDFRNMHLIGHIGDDCVSQRLIIRSPLTGLSVGPFCGYDGLPNIVSAGNLLIVELQSPHPTNGKEYKGFQMVYTETVQATSPGLRPPEWSNGMFLEYSPTVRTKPSRYKPTQKINTNNAEKLPTTKKPPSKPKEPKNKTPKEKDRVMSNSNGPWNYPPAVRPYIPPRVPTRIRPEDKEDSMGTEAIVGIIVGGIVAIAIISVVVAKLSYYRSNKEKKRAEQEAEDARNMQGFQSYTQKAIPIVHEPSPAYTAPPTHTRHKHTGVTNTNEKVAAHREGHRRNRLPDKRQSNKLTKGNCSNNRQHASSEQKSSKDKRKRNSESRKRTDDNRDRRPRSREARKETSNDNRHRNPGHKNRKSSKDSRPKRR